MQGLNTTGTLVSICQNDKFSFSFLQNTYLGLAQAITSTASTLGFWYIQRYWKISTKRMVTLSSGYFWRCANDDVVRSDERRYDVDTFVGYDWYLDAEVRVR